MLSVKNHRFTACYPSIFFSSGDEVEYNHELEDSTENFENDFNLVREDIERRSM